MWVITTEGFYSAVEHRRDPNLIMVRARAKADLERLRRATGLTFRIKRSQDWADYPYRTTLQRADWVEACAILAGDVDYTNFKNAVHDDRGKARANIYMSVWSALRRIEPPRKIKWPKLPARKERLALPAGPLEGEAAARYLRRERDGDDGCAGCGTFLLSAERTSLGGSGYCDPCDQVTA